MSETETDRYHFILQRESNIKLYGTLGKKQTNIPMEHRSFQKSM